MARVTGLTAERMLEIEASSIVGGAIDLSGHLKLMTRGGIELDAGEVRGDKGDRGLTGPPGIGPTGTVIMHAAPTVPGGWLKCDGRAVSRASYPELFHAIGTTYGVGDNISTFNLPNLVGRVAVGQGGTGTFSSLGAAGGSETVTLTADQMPVHTHVQDPHAHTQAAHNHTQAAHGHSQNSHGHAATRHSHTSYAHDHAQSAHSHGADHGSLGWKSGVFATGSSAGISTDGSARSTTSVTANNGTTEVSISSEPAEVAVATATNNNATATNNAATATNNSTTATNKNAGGGAAHPNMQPYQVLNYIIKT